MTASKDNVQGAKTLASSLSLRTRKFFRICHVPQDLSTLNGEESVSKIEVHGDIVSTQWSSNGAIFAVIFQDQGLVLYTLPQSDGKDRTELHSHNLALPQELQKVPGKQLKWISFSPKGSYLSTFWVPGGHGMTELTGPNYLIWKICRSPEGVITGTSIVLSERNNSLSYPGPMQWRDDEEYRIYTSNNEIHILEGGNFAKPPICTLSNPGRKYSVTIAPKCALAPDGIRLTLFSPASHDGVNPGSVCFMVYKGAKGPSGIIEELQLVQATGRELPGVDGCDFLWSPSSCYCLLMTSTLVDAAGDNYGSVGDLWLCSMNGPNGTITSSLQSPSDTPSDEAGLPQPSKENTLGNHPGSLSLELLELTKINERVTQDAKWSPIVDEFILIEGKAPSDAYLYDGPTAQRLHTFSKGYKNQVVWNHQGDMVALGGFGNLAGDLSFYYRDPNRQVTLINECRAACTVLCDWSPCGTYFFTASIRPRMNVDNQIKLWSREGNELLHIPFDELYGVEWKAEPACRYTKPPAPKPSEKIQSKSTYRPRNWASASTDSQLVIRYYNGEITEAELPEEFRKKLSSTRMSRANGGRRYGAAASDKNWETAMDWRSSEPVSEDKKESEPVSAGEAAASQSSSKSPEGSPGVKPTRVGPSVDLRKTEKDGPPTTRKAKKGESQSRVGTIQQSAPPAASAPQPKRVKGAPEPTEAKDSVPKEVPKVVAKKVADPPKIVDIPKAAVTMPSSISAPQRPPQSSVKYQQSPLNVAKPAMPPQGISKDPVVTYASNSHEASFPMYPAPDVTSAAAPYAAWPNDEELWPATSDGVGPEAEPNPVYADPAYGARRQMSGPNVSPGQQYTIPAQVDPVETESRAPTVPTTNSLSDNSIVSLLQSILPHAKVHVQTEAGRSAPQEAAPLRQVRPQSYPAPPINDPAVPTAESLSQETESLFFRYFREGGTNRPSAPVTYQPPRQQTSKALPRNMPPPPATPVYNASGGPSPYFSKAADDVPNHEKEVEQARFLALIEQAGLKLPLLSPTKPPAPPPFREGPSIEERAPTQTQQTQQWYWQQQNAASKQMPMKMTAPRPPVRYKQPEPQPMMPFPRPSGPQSYGATTMSKDPILRMDASLRELLKTLQAQDQPPPPQQPESYATGLKDAEPKQPIWPASQAPPLKTRTESKRVWQYVDPKGNIQGPFSWKEMRAWWERGYFAGDLPIRCDTTAEFVALDDMFPGGQRVFADE
eukprot:Blabericola_migrator_1__5386@NODE_275_length_10491_cov_112_748561_g228_i0_p1_GENE_NODE_275_length_10491_cov_112_748561_g228_i0NODE_275_length_10491_cov_112_748561_g228_i0_p1_ORF_typecomplete_len1265_score131_25eIF2A/PF08662_11/0_004eIF2A/PF08662_11/1_5e34GYF/PF02213_16/4_1e03GYF/PF02213_16/8_4e14ANAPC4_WD40/PF12894_7/0_98ANAPC4_WD40/PF12894_7/1_7e03ANAPC4_WD40/PF12894_7/45ANAPC4_WD40/PF12894_7/0_89WD40/PF00400_32/1_9e03WD40/PF00400_32/3_3e02WD40/PF00400_32/1_5e04WD40/PF00400_32/0_034GYF_2/PF1423